MRGCLLALFGAAALAAADHIGVVKFGGLAVPGATVTLSQAQKRFSTVTDSDGVYRFADLSEGRWTVEVGMQLFAPQRREVIVGAGAPPEQWELVVVAPEARPTVVSGAQFTKAAPAETAAVKRPEKEAAPTPDPSAVAEVAQRAADGYLINGSVNNGASSPFAQLPAFGNHRRGPRALYNGQFGVIANNSVFDARAFSLTGQNTPKPDYNRLQALFSFGGPLKIPHLIKRNGPMVTLNYQWTRNSNASTQTGRMPTLAERSGDFSGSGTPVLDPATGVPFPNNRIPSSRISPQARTLLDLYPTPNFPGSARYNYQIPVLNALHQDDLQSRINKQVRRNFFSGEFAMQSTRTDNTDAFGFLNTGSVGGFNAAARYRRSLNARTFFTTAYQFSRLETRVTPFFSGQRDVTGEAAIEGTSRAAADWGTPTLRFASGISSLSQPQSSVARNQTGSVSGDAFLSRGRHNASFGYTYRKQQFNVLSQQDPRGTFVFTGSSAGNDFAGFLLGTPDTASVAYGNADKYLRASISEAFVNDDFRVRPGLTINAGVRWEYWSSVTEKYGRLVNLDIAPGFSGVSPTVARDGNQSAFPQPDRNNFQPRIAFSWRPFGASATVIRGGYGIYYDTSVYQPIAMQMAQQAPLSHSLRISGSPENPLNLANALITGASTADSVTFAVDPGYRVGYSQNWQLSIQRDLPGALQVTTTYSGGKGTRGQQYILPNTFPDGAVYPSGFTYLMSNGNAIRHSGSIELRRRLRSGFTGGLQYTWAKSLDNASLGGKNQSTPLIAQNWQDLKAERARSDFDQRHLLAAMVQYTTGMGIGGGTLLQGWRGTLLKEWTFGSQITAGTGLPLNPVYLTAVPGTGVTGTVRPDYTGASLYDSPDGLFLNPAAISAPVGGWGNAGRNSITGPHQFALGASLGRTFRSTERVTADLRITATNALNNVTYTAWNTVAGSPLFGLASAANPMRSVQVAFRTRF